MDDTYLMDWWKTFDKRSEPLTILLSGGFDPLHVGHIQMIFDAQRYGKVLIALNSDDWLERKKGYVFMPFHDRAAVLCSLKGDVVVCSVDDSDDTVCSAIRELEPDMFGNGGDRTVENTPEISLCHSRGIQLIWNLGGKKICSSSELVAKSGLK